MRRLAKAVLIGFVVAIALLLALGAFLRRPSFGRPTPPPRERADAARLRQHVDVLTTEFLPRAADDPASLERTAAYVEAAFLAAGARIENQRYTAGADYRNVIGSFGPLGGPRIIVGAHYEAMGLFGTNPGADHKASRPTGLLEH